MTMTAPAPTPLPTAAREWYDADFAVIPSHSDGSKRPFGNWKSYQKERPTWDDVEEWLGSGRFDGIGILTGHPSGNAELIEIEGPMDDAVERLGRVAKAAQGFADIGVPDLLTRIASGCVEQSAGGGLHLFIRVTDGPAKGNTKLAHTGQGTDRHVISETRGEGGFVVVAPTPGRNGHPEGAAYLFVNGGAPAKTVEVTSEERDILHMLFTLALDEATVVPDVVPPSTAPSTPYEGLSAFDDYRQRVTWRDILAPLGWREGFTAGDGRTHWTRPGGQGFEGTSATTIEDGPMFVFSTSVDMPQEVGLSKGQAYAHLHHGGDLSAAARSLTEQGYGDTTSHDIPAWEAVLDPDATPQERTEAAMTWVDEHLPRVDWHDLWTQEHKEEWIVEPLLAARRLVALYSAPKVGKSLLMLEIAAAVANGRAMFGYPKPARAYRTLYVDFENDPIADIRERLTNMGYKPEHLENLVMLSFPNLGYLDTERGSLELMAAVTHYGCEIVVIDTVSRSIEGDENENDTWLDFYRHTGLKLKQAKVALIRLDHAGKDVSKGQRGGSAKSGDVDAVWRMSEVGEERFELVCEAQRFPISATHITLDRVDDSEGLRHVVVANPGRERENELMDALVRLDVDKDGTKTAAEKALRADGVKFKGRIPAYIWDRYRATPRAFQVTQGSL